MCMDNIIFTSKGKPDVTRTVTETQTLLRTRFNDDSVDLAILGLLSGKTMYLTINGVTVSARKAN